jgi:hypothetical protein
MPLPKRGPHLRKRPPLLAPAPGGTPSSRAVARGRARRRSAGAAGSRSAGRGGPQPRLERVTVRRGLGRRPRRQGPAAAHSRPTTPRPDRTDDRAPTDGHPRLQPPVPTPDSSPALFPPNSASHRWSTHPSQIRHQPTCHARPARCRRPAPGPPAPAWANPHHIYLAGRGRGASATRWPPFLASPGGKRNTAGGGVAACSRLERTPRDEHQETNSKVRNEADAPVQSAAHEGSALSGSSSGASLETGV